MRVLALTTQKGGSGKHPRRLARRCGYAGRGNRHGARYGSAGIAGRLGQEARGGWARRSACGPAAFAGTLGRIRSAKTVSLVIVDTPGRFGPDVALVLREASLCLLPVKPSILDVEAARPTVEQLRLLKRQFAFVLNQCNPTTQARTLDAATALVSTGALAPSMVATRSDFLDSMTTGQGVTELAPKGKAAVEVRLLWQWIKAQLEGTKA